MSTRLKPVGTAPAVPDLDLAGSTAEVVPLRPSPPRPTPFATHAAEALKRGWHPIPTDPDANTKKPSRRGDTGHDGEDYTERQIADLIKKCGHHGIGLRMPHGVIGIDVDHRDGKVGMDHLAAFQQRLGLPDLPATVFVTSKEHPSGIHLFGVPLGMVFNDKAIDDVDVIQRHHRFVQGPGSIHPKTGAEYRAFDLATGEVLEVLPHVDEIVNLPTEWVRALHVPKSAARAEGREPIKWENPNRRRQMSQAVKRALDSHWTQPHRGGRHPALLSALGALVRIDSLRGHGTSLAIDVVEHEFIAAVTADGTRTEAEASREFKEAYAYCIAGVAATVSTLDDGDDGIVDLSAEREESPFHLPESFWASRESLQRVRRFAHANGASGGATLAAVLARVAANTAPNVTVRANAKGPVSLNYAVAILAATGGGKTSACTAAVRAVEGAQVDVDNAPPSSAEGMVEAYWGMKEEAGEGGKKRMVRQQTKRSALFFADEGEEFILKAAREGATALQTMRSLWFGADAGSTNATAERTRHIKPHRYRWCFVAGFQDGKADPILADDLGGTPQRFLWVRAEDPTIPYDPPEVEPVGYNPHFDVATKLPKVLEQSVNVGVMGFPKHIGDEIYRKAIQRQRGELQGDIEDSQRPVLTIKTAALLALLDGRHDVTEEDWHLADVMVETSNAVRRQAVANAERRQLDSDRRSAEREGDRRAITEERVRSRHEEDLERVARALAKTLDSKGSMKRNPLRTSLANRDRSTFDDAVALAIDNEWIELEESVFRIGAKIVEVRS